MNPLVDQRTQVAIKFPLVILLVHIPSLFNLFLSLESISADTMSFCFSCSINICFIFNLNTAYLTFKLTSETLF